MALRAMAVDDWKQKAREAQLALRGTSRGSRAEAWRKAAGSVDSNTVRRWVFSIGYLDQLKKMDANAYKSIEDAPLSIVEILARWHTFDLKGSIKAVRSVAEGKHTVATLTAAMRAARKTSVANRTGESLAAAYRAQVEPIAAQVVAEELGGMISNPSIDHKEADYPRLDFKFLRMDKDGKNPQSVGVIIVGPYSSDTGYYKRRQEWLSRAFALAWIYDHIILWLPLAADPKPYLDWTERAKEDAVRLTSRSNRDKDSESPRAEQRIPNVHIVRPASPEERKLKPEAKSALAGFDPN
jgi:hypothetical protein